MPPKRIVLYMFEMSDDPNGIVHDATWLAVSAAWYARYWPETRIVKRLRYYNYAVNNGIVFG